MDSGQQVGEDGDDALNANAAPCATTECHVPLSQTFALFSEPAVWIKSLRLRKVLRIFVYDVRADGNNGLNQLEISNNHDEMIWFFQLTPPGRNCD